MIIPKKQGNFWMELSALKSVLRKEQMGKRIWKNEIINENDIFILVVKTVCNLIWHSIVYKNFSWCKMQLTSKPSKIRKYNGNVMYMGMRVSFLSYHFITLLLYSYTTIFYMYLTSNSVIFLAWDSIFPDCLFFV